MKPCERYERDLLLMLHGQLGPFSSLLMRFHLLTCTSCRERLSTFRRLSTRLATGMRRPNSARPMGVFIPKAAFAGIRVKGLLMVLVGLALFWVYSFTTNALASGSGTSGGPVVASSGVDTCRVAPLAPPPADPVPVKKTPAKTPGRK